MNLKHTQIISRVDFLTSTRDEAQALDCQAQELLADHVRILVDLTNAHLCNVGGGPCGIFPRRYIWGDPSHLRSILGRMVSEFKFMKGSSQVGFLSVIGASSSNSRLVF